MEFKNETYKGYNLEFSRDSWRYINVRITKYKNKETRRQEYILELLPTYERTKKEALRITKLFIDDNSEKLKFTNSGLSQAKYLPK